MRSDHPDYDVVSRIVAEMERLSGGADALRGRFPFLIQEAVDFVLDPVRTARTHIRELDNVEKTFIGLKVEHFLRDFLGVPKGLRDLQINGIDVDVKNTVRTTWMIPPETFRNEEPCVLVMVATQENECSLGVFVARTDYLNAANRDKKRSVSSKAFEHIWWIIKGEPLPESRFAGFDMARFRELRSRRGGSKRAAQFIRENLGLPIHRNVVLGLLHDQDDPMKRLRGNGGARDILAPEGIAFFSGKYHAGKIAEISRQYIGNDHFVGLYVGTEEAIRFAKEAKKNRQ